MIVPYASLVPWRKFLVRTQGHSSNAQCAALYLVLSFVNLTWRMMNLSIVQHPLPIVQMIIQHLLLTAPLHQHIHQPLQPTAQHPRHTLQKKTTLKKLAFLFFDTNFKSHLSRGFHEDSSLRTCDFVETIVEGKTVRGHVHPHTH